MMICKTFLMQLHTLPMTDLMMPRVMSLDSSDNLAYTIFNMIQHRFSRFPVTQEDRLVGIITSMDVLQALNIKKDITILESPVADHMTTEVISCGIEEQLGQVIGVMTTNNVSCIPLVNNEGIIEGVFTNKDLLLLNSLWREFPDIVLDENSDYLIEFDSDLILREDQPISKMIDVMIKNEFKMLLIERKDGEIEGAIPIYRVMKSIATSLLSEGLSIDYLDKQILDRLVIDSLIKAQLPAKVSEYRRLVNARGVDALFLKNETGDFTHIIRETGFRDLSYRFIREMID